MRGTSASKVFVKNNKAIQSLATIALFVSFTAVCSQISIPLPFTPVPLNLALLSVFMSGIILGSIKGTVCQIVYISLGCTGVPVFANFQGGIGIIIGPTGGYIVGYIVVSFIVWLLGRSNHTVTITALSMALGLFACYALGTMWFVIITGTKIFEALFICAIPFVIGDALKIIFATALSKRLPAINFFV